MSIQNLFDEWEQERKARSFVRDGIINEELFSQSRSKIMVLMKEAPESQGTNYINKELEEKFNKYEDTAIHDLFLNLARRTYAISSIVNGLQPVEYKEIAESQVKNYQYSVCLRSSAYINVKKYHGRDRSDEKDLKKVAAIDRKNLRKQIDHYINPKIVLTNSTYSMYKEIYEGIGFRRIGDSHFYIHQIDGTERLIKEGMHPQQSKKSDQEVYESLVSQLMNAEIQEWIEKHLR